MVTRAGKELLKNTIQTVNFHNRILEENEMWRQWELQQGLTMMVSDDIIKGKRIHKCSYHRKKQRIKEKKKRMKQQIQKAIRLSNATDRWDHGGYKKFYPSEDSSSSEDKKVINSKKWDHGGYKKFYPSEDSSSSEDKKVINSKKWGHDGFKELYPPSKKSIENPSDKPRGEYKKHKTKRRSADQLKNDFKKGHQLKNKKRTSTSSESEEIWVESTPTSKTDKNNLHSKRLNKHKTKRRREGSSTSSDSSEIEEVWVESTAIRQQPSNSQNISLSRNNFKDRQNIKNVREDSSFTSSDSSESVQILGEFKAFKRKKNSETSRNIQLSKEKIYGRQNSGPSKENTHYKAN